jgi:hypothetical protein
MLQKLVDSVVVVAALVVVILGSVALAKRIEAEQEATVTVTLRHDTGTQDREFEYFRLAMPDGTAVLVIGDKDLKLTEWLVSNANRKLRIDAQPVTPERIQR